MKKKLDIPAKVNIVLSREQSLREIAAKHGVHHSSIDDLFKESTEVLTQYWEEKSQRIGRPGKAEDDEVLNSESDNNELSKQLALKQMRIDWLELQLKIEKERAAEAKLKKSVHLKKKEKIAIIELTTNHEREYSEITQLERLSCLDMSPGSLLHLQRTLRDRLKRESVISDEDIAHTVQQIIDYPFLGGEKGRLKLQHDEKTLVGATLYKEIKQQLKQEVEKELHRKREQSELEKNQYKRSVEKTGKYKHFIPTKAHDVWSIDFLTVALYGMYFNICVVYEIFSQAYLAIKVSDSCSAELAIAAVNRAVEYSGKNPTRYLLSDNGSAFICDSFEKALDSIGMTGKRIPPGKPWFNGALESGNRDFKKTLYTIAFQDACNNTKLSAKGIAREKIMNSLNEYSLLTQCVINEEIVRPKFKATPESVLKNEIKESLKKQAAFVATKKQERKERLAVLKDVPVSKRKRVEDKVLASCKKNIIIAWNK